MKEVSAGARMRKSEGMNRFYVIPTNAGDLPRRFIPQRMQYLF
jgi:hypothetical protein